MTNIPDLWWSPSMGRFLTRHENGNDEHLVWVVQMNHESLRHFLGTGPDSNPPLPDDAVQLAPMPAPPQVFFPGDTMPTGVYLINGYGGVLMPEGESRELTRGPYVELFAPSREEWQSIVDRARAEREEKL